MLVEQQVTPNTLFGDTLMLDDANELLSEMSVQAMPAQVIPAPVISTPVIPEPVKDPWAPNWRTPCNVYGDKNCGLRIYGKHPHLSQDRLHFAAHHAKLFWNFIRHPSEIPGDNIYEKAYAVGVLPVVIPCVVLGGSYVKISRVLRYITKKSTSNHDSWEISRFDKDKGESDFIKARKELGRSLFANGMSSSDEATSLENKFNYYVASYMACFCSVAYSAADKPEFIKESGDNFEQSVLRSALKRPPNADDEPRGLGYKIVYNDGDILLAFKGTTFDFIQDLLSDAAFFRHSNNDEVCKEDKGKGDGAAGKCDTICYRHSYDNRKCSERCIQGCATHAKYLDGEVHQGFYDLLFRPLPNPPSEHLYLTEGPVNAMAVIMEMVLYQVLNADRGRHVSNLWLTGHSLGGALASLVMARLQTTVEDHDPLVRGFDVEDRKRFTGSTVLYVMASQAIANFPAAYACQNCKDEKCKTKDWKNCHDCSNCTMLRSRERRRITWTSMCNSCNVRWEALWTDACQGCKNFMDGEPDLKNTDPTTADPYACQKIGAENCFCGDCGQCDDCKDMTDCQRCNRRRKYWPWILLRDCYTFGSPKVGDTEFARAFDQNKRKSFERIVADRMAAREGGQELTPDEMGSITSRHLYSWPAYWRIANTFDPVTKLPFGRDAYTEKEADDRADDSNNRGSLLDYQHVGYLVQLPSDSSQLPLILPPAVRRRAKGMELYDRFEKYERDRIKGSIQSKDATLNQNQLKETRRLLDKLWTPFKCLLNLSSHYIRNYSDGLLSAEEHFTTYSDKIVTESTGVLLRRFIFDTIGWILGLSSPDESSDRSSDAHKSYGDCDESRPLLGDTEP